MMKVGIVLQSNYPFDIRVQKIAKTLVYAGFEVHILCLLGNKKQYFEIIDRIQIHRVNIPRRNYISKFWTVVNALTSIHPLWLKVVDKFVETNKIDILHINGLPLANTALRMKKKYKIKVIVDLRENYPAAFQIWNKWENNIIKKIVNKILFNYNRWTKYEKNACLKVDKIITVVEEMKERIMQMYRIPDEKIIVVTNTEELKFIKESKVDKNIMERYKSRFIISYIGGFGPHRGLDTAIEGMTYIKKEIPNSLLLLVGEGSKDVENKLKKMIVKFNLKKEIEFVGWQSFDKVFTYMHISNLGIIPHNKNEHTNNTIPYKLFQYMMVGKPVVVSSCKPLKRIVEKLKSGLVFEAGNPRSFGEKVIELYKKPELAIKYGKNGKEATLKGKWNWKNTSKTLVDFYKSI